MATDNSQALDLLDMDFEAIEDVPGFDVPHNGDYRLRLSAEVKKVGDNQCLEVGYEVMETLKKNNDADPDAVPGTKFSQLFCLQGDPEKVKKALGYAKLLLKPTRLHVVVVLFDVLVLGGLKALRVAGGNLAPLVAKRWSAGL